MTSETPKTAKAKLTRTRKAAASRAGGLLASARGLAGQAGETYHTVDSMPKSQQRTVTRASLGIGAALFILGAPRLLTLVAFLPALAVAGTRLAKHRA